MIEISHLYPQVDALAPKTPLCVMGAARNLAFSSHGVFHSDDRARLAIRCVPSTPPPRYRRCSEGGGVRGVDVQIIS